MAPMNPMYLMSLLQNGNPREAALQIIQNNYPNNPQIYNLVQMAERGDTQNLQRIAENMLGAQGRNFSAEMQNLMQTVRRF